MRIEHFHLSSGDFADDMSGGGQFTFRDAAPNEAAPAAFANANFAAEDLPMVGPSVFINEINYDTTGADTGEGVEIAGPAGTDLTGWSLVFYNGSGGASYATLALSGTLANQQNGFGTRSFAQVGIQNGAPDGIALVNASGVVVQFLSYEGVMTASNGPAAGMTSTDIGVSQVGTEPVGSTLQLTGTGTGYGDFTWATSSAGNFGAVNTGQSFGGVTPPTPGALSIADASATEGNSGTQDISFAVTRASGSSGAVSATWTVTFPANADAADLAAGTVLTGTVNFADGATSATITLPIAGDIAFEPNETFVVTLSAPTGGATLSDATATGTILNDDAAPPTPPANVFINEIHYDNGGTDVGEAIEIAGVAGTNLSGYTLVLYNGSNTPAAAPVYGMLALSGVIDDEGQGFGALSFSFPVNGLQNGVADGFALIAPDGSVVQFLSYEGTMVAASGTPAAGMMSTDIGVVEDGTGALGDSLQLTGFGSSGADFTWQPDAANSFGSLNVGQTIIPDNGTGQISVADRSVGEGDAGITNLVFTVNRAGGLGSSATVDYAIALGTASPDDLGPGAVLNGTVTFAEGARTATITIPIQGDLIGEGNETLNLTLSNPVGNIEIVDATATGTITNDDPVALAIGEIQGEGHRSAFTGQIVLTTGIVTAVDTNGFYLQSATGDGNARTSDGIFVFTVGAPGVLVGDAASVRGTVGEFQGSPESLSLTQITAPTVTVTSPGNALPVALLIGQGGLLPPTEAIDDDGLTSYDPLTDGIDFWESLEGMRVTLDAPLVVSNTNNFGETDIVVSEGVGATGVNDRGGITISPGDFNPEKIQIDDDSGIFGGFTPGYSIGDTLSSVTGIVNYAFENYEVIVTAAVAVTEDVTLAEEITTLVGDATHLSLATYNVENLDPGDGARFSLLAADIVNNLRAPDIIAVQEIQDADGAGGGGNLSGQATADALIQAIEDAGGPTYVYVEVAPTTPNSTGGEPGGNIRNGYFYNADRVSYVAGSASLIADPAYNGTRAPLVASWGFNGDTLTTINVHSTSRGGSDPLWGDAQPPANAGEGRRIDQAEAILAYVNDQLATNPALNIAVLGDFNGFYFEEEQLLLTRDGVLTNLNSLLPEEERYSYMFEGNAQALDNILTTAGLYANAQFDAVHLNSQFGAARPTDHDPQLTLLSFNAVNRAPVAVNDSVAVNEDAGTINLWNTVLGNDTDPDGDVLTISSVDTTGTLGSLVFDIPSQKLRYLADDDAFDALSPGATLVDSFSYTVTDAGGLTSTATVSVTVTGVSDGVTRTGTKFDDNLTGTADEDRLEGLRRDDTLDGLGGDDLLFGGLDNDRLFGGDGNDKLYGEGGDDKLAGGAGADQFHFNQVEGTDTIRDFDVNEDMIFLNGGLTVKRTSVGDVNGDGVDDLTIGFSFSTTAILLGVNDINAVEFGFSGGGGMGMQRAHGGFLDRFEGPLYDGRVADFHGF